MPVYRNAFASCPQPIVNTVRAALSLSPHARSTADNGTARTGIVKPRVAAACSSSPMSAVSRSRGTLPRPLPINVIAFERNTAPGSAMFGPLAEPTWTKRSAAPSCKPLAAATSRRSALLPHR